MQGRPAFPVDPAIVAIAFGVTWRPSPAAGPGLLRARQQPVDRRLGHGAAGEVGLIFATVGKQLG